MKRLLLVTGAAVGACAIAVPAAAGLSGNPSFSEHVPVRVPTSAKVVTFDDHGGATTTEPRTPSPTSTTTAAPTVASTAKPRPTEPGDDHGSHTSTHAEPGDDHHQRGRSRTATTAAAPSSSHGHGSDDATAGHGGKHGQDD